MDRTASAKVTGVSDTQAKGNSWKNQRDYERAYYSGILAERRAKAQPSREERLGAGHLAYEGLSGQQCTGSKSGSTSPVWQRRRFATVEHFAPR